MQGYKNDQGPARSDTEERLKKLALFILEKSKTKRGFDNIF